MKYAKVENGCVVVKIKGSMYLHIADRVSDEIEEVITTGEKKIMVDLSETDYIDSSGLGVLVDAKKAMDAAGGEFQIIGLHEDIVPLFQQTRMDKELGIDFGWENRQ